MVSSPMSFFKRLTMVPQGITIVVAGFLPVLAIAAMFPVVASLIDHFAEDAGARWKVPLMISAPGLSIAILAPFAGYFADRFGRRDMLLWATFFYGIFGSAPFWLTNLDAIFASRLLLGVSEAIILTNVNALMGDYWDQAGRRNWLFFQGIAGPFMASAVIRAGGPLTEITWNGIFLIYFIAFPIFLAMKVYLFEADKTKAQAIDLVPASEVFPTRNAVFVGGVTLFASFLYYVFIINGSLAFREIGVIEATRVSELTYLPSLFVMLGSLIFWLLGRTSNALQLGTFLLLIGGGLAGIGLAETVPQMLAALIVQQTGAGMAVPALIAWAHTKFSFTHRGRGMGLWTACFFFGQFSSPWIVHKLNDAFGTMQSAFTFAGVAGLAAAAMAAVFHVRNSARARSAPSISPAG